ncbi:hypothetical protein DMI69_02115 [Escherichia coli]|nr:hypothetical protein [Escherichia coli]
MGGGYVAALRAAQNGLSVVCIDDGVNAQGEPSPGGTMSQCRLYSVKIVAAIFRTVRASAA